MKKVNIRHSITRLLLFTAVILWSSTQIAFAQNQENEGAQPMEASSDVGDAKAETGAAAEPTGLGDPDKGKELFNTNCAACHKRYKRSTGPALNGVTSKQSMDWIYEWVHNSAAMIATGDADANAIFEEFNGTPMTPFPQLSEEDIDNIMAYVEMPKPEPTAAVTADGGASASGGGGGMSADIVLGLLAVVLLLLVVILVLVNKTLSRFAESSGVPMPVKEKRKPIWKVFVENQFLVLITSVFLILAGGYFVYGYLMQIGIDQGYQPIQPIHYSHRIHAGDNEIACKYCHSSARVSQTSGIPALNVCMNCHVAISEVAPETATEDYSKDYYDGEIQKLYKAVGWDPAKQAYTGETHPVKWIRIHNLPDFVYYNHSQHVTVAGVECQHCHGPIEDMEVVQQFAPLTMGWCINCHKETNVNMKGNAYYKKMHDQLSKKYGVETLTAAQMGATECGKCHY